MTMVVFEEESQFGIPIVAEGNWKTVAIEKCASFSCCCRCPVKYDKRLTTGWKN